MRYQKGLTLIFVCFLMIWQSQTLHAANGQSSSAKRQQPSRLRLHLGQFSRYSDNFSLAGSDESKDEVVLTTLSGKGSFDFVRSKASTLTAETNVARTFVSDTDDVDWYQFSAALDWEFGQNRIRLTYFHNPDGLDLTPLAEGRLSNGENGIDLRLSRRLTRRSRIRLGYKYASGDLVDLIQENSDAGKFEGDITHQIQNFLELTAKSSADHELEGDVRYKIHDLFIPSLGCNLAQRRDKSDASSYDQATFIFRLESRIEDAATLNLRYRYRLRDYTTDDPTASNFDRRDYRHSGELNLLYKSFYHWWPFLYGSYKENDSTRANSSYTVYEVGIGMIFRFQ